MRAGILAIVASLAWIPRAHAACPARAADLVATASAIERAYEDLDDAGYEAGQRALAAELACVTEPLRPALAAEVDRLVGLDALLAGDVDRARAAFRAAYAIEPDWAPSPALFPPDHPLHALLAEARRPAEGEGVPLPGTVLVDGARASVLPAGTGGVVQRVEGGVVVATAWIGPGDALPDWLRPPPPPTRRRPTVALGVAAGASGIAAGALYGLAWAERGRFDDPDLPHDEIEPTAARVNGAIVGAGVAGAAAVALATVATLSVRW